MSKEARIYREEHKLPGLFEILQRVNSAYKGSFEFVSSADFEHHREALRLTWDHWEHSKNQFEFLLRDLVLEGMWQCEKLHERYTKPLAKVEV